MKPHEFIEVAVALSQQDGEAARRSSVSRAYYGVFHAARLLLEEACGILCPESAEAHKKIAFCLQHSADPRMMVAGDQLEDLRLKRNRADYQLSNTNFRDETFIQLQMLNAQRLFSYFVSAKANLGTIRKHIRIHARDVLKMNVRGND